MSAAERREKARNATLSCIRSRETVGRRRRHGWSGLCMHTRPVKTIELNGARSVGWSFRRHGGQCVTHDNIQRRPVAARVITTTSRSQSATARRVSSAVASAMLSPAIVPCFPLHRLLPAVQIKSHHRLQLSLSRVSDHPPRPGKYQKELQQIAVDWRNICRSISTCLLYTSPSPRD